MYFSREAQRKSTWKEQNVIDYNVYSILSAFLYDSVTILCFQLPFLFSLGVLWFLGHELMLGWVLLKGFCTAWLKSTFLQGRFAKAFLWHLCNFSPQGFLN